MTQLSGGETGAGGFPETADIETSSERYARRFAGPTGRWMLAVQERIALRFVGATPGREVLDVGGGHGQIALPMCREGYRVTVLGSAESCRARIAAAVEAGQCRFLTGSVLALPFSDRAFDTVVCFRLITHCRQWRRLIAELCRVARHAVVADYPTAEGLNALAPRFFEAKRRVEGDTRTWTLFRHREVAEAFAANGYAVRAREGQFFLPMVLHRMVRCWRLSAAVEAVCRAAGLTRRWGSPVILWATRRH